MGDGLYILGNVWFFLQISLEIVEQFKKVCRHFLIKKRKYKKINCLLEISQNIQGA